MCCEYEDPFLYGPDYIEVYVTVYPPLSPIGGREQDAGGVVFLLEKVETDRYSYINIPDPNGPNRVVRYIYVECRNGQLWMHIQYYNNQRPRYYNGDTIIEGPVTDQTFLNFDRATITGVYSPINPSISYAYIAGIDCPNRSVSGGSESRSSIGWVGSQSVRDISVSAALSQSGIQSGGGQRTVNCCLFDEPFRDGPDTIEVYITASPPLSSVGGRAEDAGGVTFIATKKGTDSYTYEFTPDPNGPDRVVYAIIVDCRGGQLWLQMAYYNNSDPLGIALTVVSGAVTEDAFLDFRDARVVNSGPPSQLDVGHSYAYIVGVKCPDRSISEGSASGSAIIPVESQSGAVSQSGGRVVYRDNCCENPDLFASGPDTVNVIVVMNPPIYYPSLAEENQGFRLTKAEDSSSYQWDAHDDNELIPRAVLKITIYCVGSQLTLKLIVNRHGIPGVETTITLPYDVTYPFLHTLENATFVGEFFPVVASESYVTITNLRCLWVDASISGIGSSSLIGMSGVGSFSGALAGSQSLTQSGTGQATADCCLYDEPFRDGPDTIDVMIVAYPRMSPVGGRMDDDGRPIFLLNKSGTDSYVYKYTPDPDGPNRVVCEITVECKHKRLWLRIKYYNSLNNPKYRGETVIEGAVLRGAILDFETASITGTPSAMDLYNSFAVVSGVSCPERFPGSVAPSGDCCKYGDGLFSTPDTIELTLTADTAQQFIPMNMSLTKSIEAGHAVYQWARNPDNTDPWTIISVDLRCTDGQLFLNLKYTPAGLDSEWVQVRGPLGPNFVLNFIDAEITRADAVQDTLLDKLNYYSASIPVLDCSAGSGSGGSFSGAGGRSSTGWEGSRASGSAGGGSSTGWEGSRASGSGGLPNVLQCCQKPNPFQFTPNSITLTIVNGNRRNPFTQSPITVPKFDANSYRLPFNNVGIPMGILQVDLYCIGDELTIFIRYTTTGSQEDWVEIKGVFGPDFRFTFNNAVITKSASVPDPELGDRLVFSSASIPPLDCKDAFASPPPPVAAKSSNTPQVCIHLGENTGQRLPCPCPFEPLVDVYRCAKMKVCTLRKQVLSVPCCRVCDYKETSK